MSTLSYSAIITERSLVGREPLNEPGVRSKFEVRDLSFWYGDKQALWNVSMTVPERSVMALIAGSTQLTSVAAFMASSEVGLRVSLGLALFAVIMVAIAENARIPVDNPATHLELTMVHEAMVLEYSGRHLALIDLSASLKLLLYVSLMNRRNTSLSITNALLRSLTPGAAVTIASASYPNVPALASRENLTPFQFRTDRALAPSQARLSRPGASRRCGRGSPGRPACPSRDRRDPRARSPCRHAAV